MCWLDELCWGGFILGHQFKLGTDTLNDWVYRRGVSEVEAQQVCNYLEVIARSVTPRVIGLQDSDTPIIIYSDGAFESGNWNSGALLFTTPWTTSDGFFLEQFLRRS